MRNIAIVEDEQDAADRLRSFLLQYGEEKHEEFKIFHFKDALLFLTNYKSDYDVVFMDIELPDLDGMAASKKLREIDADVMLIFVTNMAQFAVGGYEVDAFDFIVKPVSYFNFALKFGRALARLNNNADAQVWINGKSGNRRIAVADLKYVEVADHVLVYHTVNGDFTASGTLSAVQKQLPAVSFALCNRCYMVNLRYVSEVEGFRVVVGGETLQISHPKKRDFVRALNIYLRGCRGDGSKVKC